MLEIVFKIGEILELIPCIVRIVEKIKKYSLREKYSTESKTRLNRNQHVTLKSMIKIIVHQNI